MSLTMFQASVPVFARMLKNLSAILTKAEAYAEARKIDPAALLGTRLFPDMFPLTRQVQLSADFAKNTAARLAGVEIPKFPDEEKSFAELQQRLARTRDFVKSLTAAQIDGSEQREINLTIAGEPITFTGQDYLLHFALPNFYFHLTAAYAILRHCGLEIGKRDFIGPR
jgi:uncharacterized protein